MTNPVLPARVASFYDATDALDVAGYAAALAPGAVVTFGNLPSVVGRDAARENFAAMKATMLTSISHRVRDSWESETTVCIEAEVTYGMQDGRQLTLPCVSVLDLDGDGLIAALRMYLDPAPLFAEAPAEAVA